MQLYHYSVEVISRNQHQSGAYIASPSFENYKYCWLRDGSFIAHAMDRTGEFQSAEAFFRWVDRTINKYAFKVNRLEEQLKTDPKTKNLSILHTRYTLDGEEEDSDSAWGNFQIDGYGTWLWALAKHIEITGNYGLLTEFAASINTTIRYLNIAWQLPNYDCWEEHPEFLHPYSLAAIYGGLQAIERVQTRSSTKNTLSSTSELAQTIKQFLLDSAVYKGRFVKHLYPAAPGKPARPVIGSGVDASLLGLAVPYEVFPFGDPLVVSTISAIEKDLHRRSGGVYRYKGDVYYGGGEWILLSAWLGSYYIQTGNTRAAQNLLAWIEHCADKSGNLPEQVNDHLLAPAEYQPWVERWGVVASPLLWSHAMYLILYEELNNKTQKMLLL